MANNFLHQKAFILDLDRSGSTMTIKAPKEAAPRLPTIGRLMSLQDIKVALDTISGEYDCAKSLRLEWGHFFGKFDIRFGVAVGECVLARLPHLKTLVVDCLLTCESLVHLLSFVPPRLSKLELRNGLLCSGTCSILRKIGEFTELTSLVLDSWSATSRFRGANSMEMLAESLNDLPLLQEFRISRWYLCSRPKEGCMFSPMILLSMYLIPSNSTKPSSGQESIKQWQSARTPTSQKIGLQL